MLLVKKILVGEQAAQHLPFALSELRALARRWDGKLLSKVLRNDPEAFIRIHVRAQDRGEVSIIANPLAYEFFSSQSQAGNPLSVEGSFTEALGRRPITSTIYAKEGASGPDWAAGDMPQQLLTHLTVNRQRNPQYTWWGRGSFMQSTLGIASAGNSFDGRRIFRGLFTTAGGVRFEVDAYFTYDVGYDVAPTFYAPGQTLPLMPLTKAPLWWRRAAVRRAGGRRFVIATDAHSNFYAYPLKQDGAGTERLNGGFAVPPTGYRKVSAADYMPGWVSVPTVGTMRPAPSAIQYGRSEGGAILLQFTVIDQAYVPPSIDYSGFPGEEAGWNRVDLLQDNHYVWAFNSDASRAVAVVGGDELPRVVEESSAHPNTGEAQTRTVPFKHLRNYSQSVRVPYWTEQLKGEVIEDLGGLREVSATRRGVLEVDLLLEVTGEGDMDFTFDVVPRQEITDQCFVDADYAFDDPRLAALGAQKDTLLLAGVKRYMHKAGGAWAPGADPDSGPGVSCRTYLEVQRDDGAAVKAWQLGAYAGPNVIAQPAADLAFGDFGTAFAPYGTYLDYGIDYSLGYKDVQIESQSARVSVLALDLRSLSAVLECETYADPANYGEQATEYGVNTSVATYFFGAKVGNPHPALTGHLDVAPPVADTVMPHDFKGSPGDAADDDACIWLDLYRIDLDFMLGELQNGHGVATHPKGHAAFALVRGASQSNFQAVDMIHRRAGAGNRSSTHLQAFNAAWARGRTYSDYAPGGALYPGRLQGYAVWRDVQPKKVTGFSYE